MTAEAASRFALPATYWFSNNEIELDG